MQINYGYCGNPVLPSDSNFLARCTTQYRTVFSSPIRIARIDLPRFRHAVYRRCIPSSSSSWIRWFGGIVGRILIHPPPREYGFERNNGMRERGGFETRGDDRACLL